jgi:hypothetical protein
MKPSLFIVIGVTGISSLCGAVASEKKSTPPAPKSPEAEEVHELPETGKNLPRENGGWLNVEATGAQLIVKFFDADKKPVAPDVDRAAARFRYAGKSSITRTVLNRDGDSLASPGNVRPPHNFLVTLTLLQGGDGSEDAVEGAEILNFKYP